MMKYYLKRHSMLCIVVLTLWACSGEKVEHQNKEGVETVLPSQPNEVTVMELKAGTFNHELVSNGKVAAMEYADLYFRTGEVIQKIYVKNGERVREGQKLAELDKSRLNNALEQQENALQQAILEMKDVLIGQGYAPDDFESIPEEIKNLAMVRSGYNNSKSQYEAAHRELGQAILIAPFDGVVANLFDKAHNMAKTGEPFCRIIGTASMEVDFTVLESELPLIKVGDKVVVTPYSSVSEPYAGSISEINPVVDENGLVRVKAKVNGGGKLFDGMNVRISVKRSLEGQMVIPKTAVVLRSGKQVMFVVEDGKAMWKYVHTGLENMTEYTLTNWKTDGLEEGMKVIITGNVNLAHEAPVKVIE